MAKQWLLAIGNKLDWPEGSSVFSHCWPSCSLRFSLCWQSILGFCFAYPIQTVVSWPFDFRFPWGAELLSAAPDWLFKVGGLVILLMSDFPAVTGHRGLWWSSHWQKARDYDGREQILVPRDNCFQSIISFRTTLRKFFSITLFNCAVFTIQQPATHAPNKAMS